MFEILSFWQKVSHKSSKKSQAVYLGKDIGQKINQVTFISLSLSVLILEIMLIDKNIVKVPSMFKVLLFKGKLWLPFDLEFLLFSFKPKYRSCKNYPFCPLIWGPIWAQGIVKFKDTVDYSVVCVWGIVQGFTLRRTHLEVSTYYLRWCFWMTSAQIYLCRNCTGPAKHKVSFR